MRKFAGFAIVLAAIAIFVACQDDVFVEPPASLTGEYVGFYVYKIDGQQAIEQPITWRFSSNGYNMWYDEDADAEGARDFCDVAGNYSLENGVTLDEKVPVNGVMTCDTSISPKGVFALDQSTDTLRMSQYDTERAATKTLKLVLVD